uniref:Proteasome 26S subunit, non-ATPase 4 n=1 Tax=Catharus ustulatus TaxID=91951 RepID=A0A8C3UQ85_CATUS
MRILGDVDNSEYMRNGDFLPTRLQAQQDAVNIVCHSKTRSNPENNVGLITLANNCEVLTTLTPDTGRILSKLHTVQPKGKITFGTGIRVAHLALKHRQGKNHKMRIIAFVGSPVHDSDKDLVKLAKRLKKEKVNVDIINFGEEEANTEKLTAFITALNGKDGSGSHLVTVPPGPSLADALISSPILAGEGGAMLGLGASDFEFGVDPSADPECLRHQNPIKSQIAIVASMSQLLHLRPKFPIHVPIPQSMLGLGASDFEFGMDPSADPELALVGIPKFPKFSNFSVFSVKIPADPELALVGIPKFPKFSVCSTKIP